VRYDRLPVDLVQAGAIAPHRDHALVPGRKCIGEGVGQACSKPIASLLHVIDFEHWQPARLHCAQGMPVQHIGHSAVCSIVPLHIPLRLPLALRTVAEEQNGRM